MCLVSAMFLRKLLNKNDAKPEQKMAPPPGMQTMGASLQKRFARGVQYNSKLFEGNLWSFYVYMVKWDHFELR